MCCRKVIISASSAAAALAFDAGGARRQKDIWIEDLTAEEAKKLLSLHGHGKNAQDIIDACASVARVVSFFVFVCVLLFAQLFFLFCSRALPVVSGGLRVGDLTESCKEMDAGKTLQELKQETEAFAKTEVRRFLDLMVKAVDGSVIRIGSNLLTELANSKQRGGDGAAEYAAGEGIVPKMLAELIRERGAHAVVWHPTQKRYQFASDFHASAAIELLRSRSPWARLRRFFRR